MCQPVVKLWVTAKYVGIQLDKAETCVVRPTVSAPNLAGDVERARERENERLWNCLFEHRRETWGKHCSFLSFVGCPHAFQEAEHFFP